MCPPKEMDISGLLLQENTETVNTQGQGPSAATGTIETIGPFNPQWAPTGPPPVYTLGKYVSPKPSDMINQFISKLEDIIFKLCAHVEKGNHVGSRRLS